MAACFRVLPARASCERARRRSGDRVGSAGAGACPGSPAGSQGDTRRGRGRRPVWSSVMLRRCKSFGRELGSLTPGGAFASIFCAAFSENRLAVPVPAGHAFMGWVSAQRAPQVPPRPRELGRQRGRELLTEGRRARGRPGKQNARPGRGSGRSRRELVRAPV